MITWNIPNLTWSEAYVCICQRTSFYTVTQPITTKFKIRSQSILYVEWKLSCGNQGLILRAAQHVQLPLTSVRIVGVQHLWKSQSHGVDGSLFPRDGQVAYPPLPGLIVSEDQSLSAHDGQDKACPLLCQWKRAKSSQSEWDERTWETLTLLASVRVLQGLAFDQARW